MNASQRAHYFSVLWPAACQAQGWNPKDAERRKEFTAQVMDAIHAPHTDSTAILDDAQVTALFTCLQHLGTPDSLTIAAAWNECQRDYLTYHIAKQADWWQERAYGHRPGRIARERFGGRRTAVSPLEKPLTRAEAQARLLTMRNRARKKHQPQIDQPY